MATLRDILQEPGNFYNELQEWADVAVAHRCRIKGAVILLQRMTRGYVIRKYFHRLSHHATVIQRTFRRFQASKMYNRSLQATVKNKHAAHYHKSATMIQVNYHSILIL